MKKIIGWFSGGITSAVAIYKAIELYGVDNIRCIFIDTHNESDDTYRFKKDCEIWWNMKIETISAIPDKYTSIEDVWIKHKGMNFANGAICSGELKRAVRERWQKDNDYDLQVFGFDASVREFRRSRGLTLNHPKAKAIYPLLMFGLSKKDCAEIIQEYGILLPESYRLGFENNNCLKTGCVQGGIGYWQWMKKIKPENYQYMGEMEHYLTNLTGKPVYICKDQSKKNGKSGNEPLFLLPHPDYPEINTVDKMKGRPPEPIIDCNGFCGVNDLVERSEEEKTVNRQIELFSPAKH